MYFRLPLLAAAAALFSAPSQGAPPGNALMRRDGPSTCAQYATLSSGPYTLQTNQWGAQYGQGSQCSTINSVNGNSIAWTTSWSWANGPNNVKSYTVSLFYSTPLSFIVISSIRSCD